MKIIVTDYYKKANAFEMGEKTIYKGKEIMKTNRPNTFVVIDTGELISFSHTDKIPTNVGIETELVDLCIGDVFLMNNEIYIATEHSYFNLSRFVSFDCDLFPDSQVVYLFKDDCVKLTIKR